MDFRGSNLQLFGSVASGPPGPDTAKEVCSLSGREGTGLASLKSKSTVTELPSSRLFLDKDWSTLNDEQPVVSS